MDGGAVASPTYQNFPSKRRTPPPPPRAPSPDAEPPALPPRKYRESQQLAGNSSSSTAGSGPGSGIFHDTSRAQVGAKEKNRIHVIPLSKQQHDEEVQIDSTKRDFKSLMNQWENSSPREDRYAAELRKQAQKFSGKQQQASAMPMIVKHSKTKISYATTYKHEPMQPQEATSLLYSSSSPSTLPHNVSTKVSVSPLLSGASMPLSSSPSSSSSLSAFAQAVASSTAGSGQHGTQPLIHSSLPTIAANTTGNVSYFAKSNNVQGSPAATTSAPSNSGPAQFSDRAIFMEDPRRRSGSDSLSSPTSNMSATKNNNIVHKNSYMLRDRSSSDHDLLSDRRLRQQQPETNEGAEDPGDVQSALTNWRPRNGPDVPAASTSPRAERSEDNLTVLEGEFPPFPSDSLDNAADMDIINQITGFADESYIGHKNKSSRAIGTYKRSKSAAVLQPNNHNYKVAGEAENIAFQETQIGQQAWSSDTAVGQPKGIGDPSQAQNERSRIVSDQVSATASTAPVRPARPNAPSRLSGNQTSSTSTQSSANSSLASTTSSTSASVFTAKPFLAEQSGWSNRRDSSRRMPQFPQESSSFDQSQSSPLREHGFWPGLNNSDTPQSQWSGEDTEKGHINSGSQSQCSPQRRSVTFDNSQSNFHSLKNSSPETSQENMVHSRPAGARSPQEEGPVSLPPRDYQRRESAPVRPVPANSSPEHKLSVPHDSASLRRQSDSSLNSTPRSEHNSDVSSCSHSRQPSQEELECDQHAQQLAQELTDKDQKLSEVLRLDANKKRMQYMDGLFSESTDLSSPLEKSFNSETRLSLKNHSPQHKLASTADVSNSTKRSSLPKEYWMSPSKALLEMELRKNEDASKDMTKDISDSSDLMKQKEELLEKLHKKLEVLKEAKLVLQQEISDNNKLGEQVSKMVASKCVSQSEKYNTLVEDLEKIVRLLLNLSGQLARAENAVQAIAPNADAKLKKTTLDKRERLYAKHEDAKKLKEDIDKRNDQLSVILREKLGDDEFSDYTHFIKMKSKLTIELQELDDKITLGGEQIQELKKSIPDLPMS